MLAGETAQNARMMCQRTQTAKNEGGTTNQNMDRRTCVIGAGQIVCIIVACTVPKQIRSLRSTAVMPIATNADGSVTTTKLCTAKTGLRTIMIMLKRLNKAKRGATWDENMWIRTSYESGVLLTRLLILIELNSRGCVGTLLKLLLHKTASLPWAR